MTHDPLTIGFEAAPLQSQPASSRRVHARTNKSPTGPDRGVGGRETIALPAPYVEGAMSIIPFLSGQQFDHQQFDQESKRVLNVAIEMVCLALRTGDCDEGVKLAIATKLIALAKAGERNPDKLCEEALKDIRRPQQWVASEATRSSVLPDSRADAPSRVE